METLAAAAGRASGGTPRNGVWRTCVSDERTIRPTSPAHGLRRRDRVTSGGVATRVRHWPNRRRDPAPATRTGPSGGHRRLRLSRRGRATSADSDRPCEDGRGSAYHQNGCRRRGLIRARLVATARCGSRGTMGTATHTRATVLHPEVMAVGQGSRAARSAWTSCSRGRGSETGRRLCCSDPQHGEPPRRLGLCATQHYEIAPEGGRQPRVWGGQAMTLRRSMIYEAAAGCGGSGGRGDRAVERG